MLTKVEKCKFVASLNLRKCRHKEIPYKFMYNKRQRKKKKQELKKIGLDELV
jgi:hypothetical protein